MAISANAVFEIRSTATASNANGGGFVTGASGTDFSQQDAAQFNLTGATSAGADAIILHASADATMVGNIAHVISGTNATAGFYEILSVVPGVSITVDRNWGSGAVAAGVVNIGGALSMVSTLDDDIFELPPAGGGVKYWVKSGTYVLGETVSISVAGGTQKPNFIEGYASTRGDSPKGATRPIFDCGANTFTLGSNWYLSNIVFTGTAATVLALGTATVAKFCKFINTSTTATRNAIALGGDNSLFFCDAQSLAGIGVLASSGVNSLFGCFIHDSTIGFSSSTGSGQFISNSLFACNKTHAIQFAGSSTGILSVANCTLYGFSTPTGIGVDFDAATTDARIVNTIITGFVTGVNHASTQTTGVDDFNDYYNNTTNATNWTLGANSITTNPTFTNVAQLSGTTASTSGSVLTQSGGDFSTVTDNQDFVYIISGTGVTVGMYPITSHTGTTITLATAPGTNATTDKAWRIITGRNFKPTVALQGAPGTSFSGSGTTNSSQIGAVQAALSSSSSSSGGAPKLGFGVFG